MQYKWHLPSDPNLYAVHFNGEDVLSGKVSVIKELQTYSMRRVSGRQSALKLACCAISIPIPVLPLQASVLLLYIVTMTEVAAPVLWKFRH